MKKLFRKIVALKLFTFAKWQLLLARPFVVAVIGTRNRTLIKEITAKVLLESTTVHTNEPQWNAEIGIPLTILRANVVGHSLFGWMATLWKAFFNIFSGTYPKVLILEIAFNAKGDMRYLSSLLKPSIVVINDMQPLSGRSFFKEKDTLEQEYLAMIRKGNKKDSVIINASLPEKKKVYEATKREVIEYSGHTGAPYVVSRSKGKEEQKIVVNTPAETYTYPTNIPGKAVEDAYAVATIIKEIFQKK